MAGHLVQARVIGANPVSLGELKMTIDAKGKKKAGKKSKPKAKKSAAKPKKAAKRAAPAKAKKPRKAPKKARPKAKAKPARKPAKKPTPKTGGSDLTKAYEDALRSGKGPRKGAKDSTRTAKKRTPSPTQEKDDKMAAAKKGKKKGAKKARKAKKSTETKAERKTAAKKGARKRTAAERSASAEKAARTRKRNKSKGKSGGKKKAKASGKRKGGKKGKKKTESVVIRGNVQSIAVHRNPEKMGYFLVTAGVGAGAGYAVADLADRYFATSSYNLKDDKGQPLYGVDAAGNPVAPTADQAAAAIRAFSWTRVGISVAISAAGLGIGMYGFKTGYMRTAFVWLGIGAAAKAGATIFGKYLLPMLFSKNTTFATRLAPEETTEYLMQHPATAGAPRGAALGDATSCGCGDDCGCSSCAGKRMQSLYRYLSNMTPVQPTPGQVQNALPQPNPLTNAAPVPEQVLARPATGGATIAFPFAHRTAVA